MSVGTEKSWSSVSESSASSVSSASSASSISSQSSASEPSQSSVSQPSESQPSVSEPSVSQPSESQPSVSQPSGSFSESSASSMSESSASESSSSCQCCEYEDTLPNYHVCQGEMLVKQIEMVWPPGSPCEGRNIIWEKSGGPEGLEVSPEGIVSWDTSGVELGWYDASAHGYDDCGCEYEVSGIIIVESCVDCCCGNLPDDATIDFSWNGNLWNLTRIPGSECDWVYDSGDTYVSVRIQLFNSVCYVEQAQVFQFAIPIFESYYNEITVDCCAIENMELPAWGGGVSAYISMNC